ncbi:aspartate carbamoyltransferase [Filifactor villosus]|uniref:Aspartate carbamoyltransferase n=1 Tax=Filifactor villosus TaxID=29374 RepID=A0ABV9QI68_9FIRM
MKHLIGINDFSMDELAELIKVGQDISEHPKKYMDRMKGRVMATLFFEPSTRTKFSFEAAMLRLGGQVIGFSEVKNSSVAKGESLKDTVETVGCYSDLIVMRHPLEGAAKLATEVLDVPLINAGDGGHQHPTQTLTDLLTIYKEMGRVDNLNIALVGDLKYGRTVHSLVDAMSKYDNNTFFFVSPKELEMPEYIKNSLKGGCFFESTSLEEVLPKVDIVYMTRIQKERFDDLETYERLKGIYILDKEKMELAKEDAIILHPLPRVNEITEEVDRDPRAKYFPQAKNGMYIRMALILKLVEEAEKNPQRPVEEVYSTIYTKCPNPKCVSNHEYVESVAFHEKTAEDLAYSCEYCDKVITI